LIRTYAKTKIEESLRLNHFRIDVLPFFATPFGINVTFRNLTPTGRWIWLGMCGFMLFHQLLHLGRGRAYALQQSYGVYLSHYLSDNNFPEAKPLDFALIGGFNFSMAMLSAPVVTIIARKYSTKLPMLLGLVGFGVGFIYIPSVAVISQWFDKKRSLANGISAAGSGIGGLMFSLMDGTVMQDMSYAWALRLTAILSVSFLFIATLLIRDRNNAIQPLGRGFDIKLLRRTDVLLLLLWAFISMFGYIALLFSLPDYAHSMRLSDTQATTVNAILNLGTAVGRPFIGIISDRFGRIEVAGLLTCACGIICFVIWLPATSYGVLVLFAFVGGAIFGSFWIASHISSMLIYMCL
ncbi:Major Facilitator Superfamily protein, partial [Penicillium sp. IBT 18751x]